MEMKMGMGMRWPVLAGMFLALFFVTLWVSGCGQPVCVAGLGDCEKYGQKDNPSNQNGGELSLTFSPAAVYAGQGVQLWPAGGKGPYSLAVKNPSLQGQNTINPSTVDPSTGVTSAFLVTPSPPPVPYATDSVGRYGTLQIEVMNSDGKTNQQSLKVYLR